MNGIDELNMMKIESIMNGSYFRGLTNVGVRFILFEDFLAKLYVQKKTSFS